jgi:hypothetical protein
MKSTHMAGILAVLVGGGVVLSQVVDSASDQWKKAFSESDEYIHALQAADKNVIEHAKIVIHNLDTKKALFVQMLQEQNEEMGKSLNSSESYLDRWAKATDLAMDALEIRYMAGLHKHYQIALQQQREIMAELKKAAPEKALMKMKVMTIYSEMKKAEDERLLMDKKMGVEEPKEPVNK